MDGPDGHVPVPAPGRRRVTAPAPRIPDGTANHRIPDGTTDPPIPGGTPDPRVPAGGAAGR